MLTLKSTDMKPKTIILLFICSTLLTSCHKEKPTGPYDPYTHISIFKAKIDNIDFESYQITIGTPDDLKYPIGIIADDNNYVISIEFPANCGERTFNFPNSDQNATIMFNNTECLSGRLNITKYDVNLVEGTFEFDVNIQDSVYKITEGFFSIVYTIS